MNPATLKQILDSQPQHTLIKQMLRMPASGEKTAYVEYEGKIIALRVTKASRVKFARHR